MGFKLSFIDHKLWILIYGKAKTARLLGPQLIDFPMQMKDTYVRLLRKNIKIILRATCMFACSVSVIWVSSWESKKDLTVTSISFLGETGSENEVKFFVSPTVLAPSAGSLFRQLL